MFTVYAANEADSHRAGGPCGLSIVVPTYRECENLPLLGERIGRALDGLDLSYEVIIVDDDSDDGTAEAVECMARAGRPVRLIVRKGQRGLSSAVLRGFAEARGEVLVCMDADLSHPPESIAQLAAAARDPQIDFALGSRYAAGGSTAERWGLLRRLNSRIATLLALPFTQARDPMSGFFALRREVFGRARELRPVGYKIGLELIVKCGCKRLVEIPIHFADRRHGRSKLNFSEQLRYLKHLKRLAEYKFGRPARMLEFIAAGATGVVVDLACYMLLLAAALRAELARGLAIWIAMTWNFRLNRRLTFSDGNTGPLLRRYGRFVAGCSPGALVSWSVSIALAARTDLLAGRYALAAVAGIVLGTVVNVSLSYFRAFRKKGGP